MLRGLFQVQNCAELCKIDATLLTSMVPVKCEKQIGNRYSIRAGYWIETVNNSMPYLPNCINNYDKTALDIRYKCVKERPQKSDY